MPRADRDDLMHVARALKTQKEGNVSLMRDLPISMVNRKQWVEFLELNNKHLDNVWQLVLQLNDGIPEPLDATQYRDDGTPTGTAQVILAHIFSKGL